MKLYPFKFNLILKPTIWGGDRIAKLKGIDVATECIGESWEISNVPSSESVVINGRLKNKSLKDIISIYQQEIVGKSVYDRFEANFPLLIKFIDACDNLSIQVHPDDKVAQIRHSSPGKTEMWYVVDAIPGSELILGFSRDSSKEEYLLKLSNNTLGDILQNVPVKKGDVFYVPAGTVHAIGKGIVIAEIQESSDITYRIYDYQRKDKNGNERDLHLDLALDVIDFHACTNPKTVYKTNINEVTPLVSSDYFTTNLISLENAIITRDYTQVDSFVIYMCLEGEFFLEYGNGEKLEVSKGETVLLPAAIKNIEFATSDKATILEVYIQS